MISPDHTLYSYWVTRFEFALPHNQGVVAENGGHEVLRYKRVFPIRHPFSCYEGANRKSYHS